MNIIYKTDVGAEIYVTSDADGNDLVAGTFIAAAGQITLQLPAGTYYVWSTKPGYTYLAPYTLTVTADETVSQYGTLVSLPATPREYGAEYGPKRVKTPNMEVEQFDPLTILKAQERQAAEVPVFPWHTTIASPNKDKYRCR